MKTGASIANTILEAKRTRLAVAEAYPILIHGIHFKPAAHVTIDAPDETEAKLLSEPQPSHVSVEGIHFGDSTLDESRNVLLKKLLTDSMLFESYPLGTVTSTFQITGKSPYSRVEGFLVLTYSMINS